MVENVKPCPICNSKNSLAITPEESYDILYEKRGTATIGISCWKCGLYLYEHDFSSYDYSAKLTILITKWNNMIRKEYDLDDGR